MRKDVKLIGAIASLLFLFGAANTTVWYVHPESTLSSIQAVFDSCSTDDTVLVGPGIYYENIDWPNTHGIDLLGEYGVDMTIIDGGGTGSVIACATGLDSTTAIHGFTITNGSGTLVPPYGYIGGGIACGFNSSPTIIGNVITGNTSNHGGGIACGFNSSPVITNNTITNNSVDATGGGIICSFNSSPTIADNTVGSNIAGWGGGIACTDTSSPKIANNRVTNNIASRYAGAIYCIYYCSPTITHTTITDNTAPPYRGAGVFCWLSSPVIDSCTIADNIGDGVCCDSASTPDINHNDIFGNTGYGVLNLDPGVLVNAENNWWGAASGPGGVGPGTGDEVGTYVDYDPWLMNAIGIFISIFDYDWMDYEGDGHADPGDTLSLIVSLLNSGEDVSTVDATISTNDPCITMINSISNYGEILGDSIEDNSHDPFVFCVDQLALLHRCTLTVTIIVDSLNFSHPIHVVIGIPPVLVVDDDGGDSYETYFTQSGDRIGVLFDLRDSKEEISSSFMLDYEALIWLTGDNPSPMDTSAVLALSSYLDSGGNLFVTGQDVEGCADTNFYHDYLHALLVEDSTRPVLVGGVQDDPIGDGLSFPIVGSPGADNQITPSIISPSAAADSIFNHGLGGCCGLRYEDSHKVVYLSFGFEAINDLPKADTVMIRILKWLGLPVGVEERVVWQDPSGNIHYLRTHPNPFKGELQIEYFAPSSSVLELRIYDAAGRVVREFLREPKRPGVYRVKWDGKNSEGIRLPSGVYFCRMAIRSIGFCGPVAEVHPYGSVTDTDLGSGDFTSTKKIILLR